MVESKELKERRESLNLVYVIVQLARLAIIALFVYLFVQLTLSVCGFCVKEFLPNKIGADDLLISLSSRFSGLSSNEILKEVGKFSNTHFIISVVLNYVYLLFSVILTFLVATEVKKLVVNLISKDTPFDYENITCTNMAKLYTKIGFITYFIISIMSVIPMLSNDFELYFSNVTTDLFFGFAVAFAVASIFKYIFESGYNLEKKKKNSK